MLQEVVILLKASGFTVNHFGFERQQIWVDTILNPPNLTWQDIAWDDALPYVIVASDVFGEHDPDLDQLCEAATQCLLNAGYRGFWAGTHIEAAYPVKPLPASAGQLVQSTVRFLFIGDQITRYSPEELAQMKSAAAE